MTPDETRTEAPRYFADGRPMARRSDFANGRHACGRFASSGRKKWCRPDGRIQYLGALSCACGAAWIEPAR